MAGKNTAVLVSTRIAPASIAPSKSLGQPASPTTMSLRCFRKTKVRRISPMRRIRRPRKALRLALEQGLY